MKTLGIVGGIGPESTVDYYDQIIELYRRQQGDGSYPKLLINSINAKVLLDAMAANRLSVITDYLLEALQQLARAGADFALIAANTPHIVFDDLQPLSPLPLLSIVEATCRAAKRMGITRAGIFGTRYTMQGTFYPAVFNREAIAIVAPAPKDQDYIHEKYLGELFKGKFLSETRKGLLRIARQMKAELGIQGLILGGTELPLILRDDGTAGIPFLDTTKIHVEESVTRLLE